MDQEDENDSNPPSNDGGFASATQMKTLMMCPICKKGFPTPSKVKRHLLAVHEKIREFQCDICSHAFSQKIHVLKHRQAVHKKELEANPDLVHKRDFRIPDSTVSSQKPEDGFGPPFQTMKVDKGKKLKRKKKISSAESTSSNLSTNILHQDLSKPLVTGTTETKVYFELRVDPQVLNIDLSKLTAIESPSTITATAEVSAPTEFNQNKPITCQVKLEPVLDNQLTLDENKFDLNKLNQQSSFDSELEKTLAQLQPIAKEFAAFEEDQGKIFQELVPLSDIKPTITEFQTEINTSEGSGKCSTNSNKKKSSGSGTNISCDQCGKKFSSPSKLRRHVRIVHEKIKPFHCHVCGKNFGQKVNLSGHLQSKHKLSEEEVRNRVSSTATVTTTSPNTPNNQDGTPSNNTCNNQSSSNATTTGKIVTVKTDDNNKKIFKCMECVFDSEDSSDMISHHLSNHVQTMFNFDTSELLLE